MESSESERHFPHLHCRQTARKDRPFPVTICVDAHCSHPDDEDHHISCVSLYDAGELVSEANFPAGTRGGEDTKAQVEVTFNIVPQGSRLELKAMAFCTKHGLWEGTTLDIPVED